MLVRRHPRGHHELDVLKVALKAAVNVPGEHVLEVLTSWQHLTAGEGRDSVKVHEVQLKVHDAALLKSLLGGVRDEVPDPGVRDTDRAREVRQWVPLYAPQEGIQLILLKGKETTSRHDMEGQEPER